MQLTENTFFGDSNRYYLEKLLGRGGFSEVWLVKDTLTDTEETLKVYAPSAGMDDDGLKMFTKELSLVHNIHHLNILTASYVGVWQNMPYLIMPYCPQGSLVSKIGSLTEDEAWKMLCEVCAGLAYLHEQQTPIIHQDIKPDNILIDALGNYVITDFGISTRAQSTLRKSVRNASTGTSAYMGPERFSQSPLPIKASDIWALGATLFELIEGYAPFGELGGLSQKGGADIPLMQANVSDKLKQTIYSMLAKGTWDRPTAAALVKEEIAGVKPNGGQRTKLETQKSQSSANQSVSNNLTFTVNGVSFNMIRVEGSTFTMGATSEQGSDAWDDEKPTHRVTLSDYYIAETEVTQALWKAVMGTNPSSFKNGDNYPVECVSWDDCKNFVSKLNSLLSSQLGEKMFALPTEAQWEYAARGGKKSKGYKYSGSNSLSGFAWYDDNSGSQTHPVKTKQPNELGLYDMSGNVWEWCQDWYGSYSSSSQTNPQGPDSGSDCVYRGGCWFYYARFCRVSYRGFNAPSDRFSYLGFRLCLLP